jgi:four helix bundle protein
MSVRGYRDLVVWQKAMRLVERVYEETGRFPREELYGLTTQLRRAAVSVPSNLAEGHGRGGGDYRRFVDIAYGSLMEVETQIELASRLGICPPDEARSVLADAAEIARMLNGLRKSLAPGP